MSRRRKKKSAPGEKRTRKGVYLLPNLLTTGSIFAAFYGIIAAGQGLWREACVAILISVLLDGLDGKVARMTGSTSRFGVEYDSLADVVAFGAAPAFLVHQWALAGHGRLGWVAAGLYVVCGALRLARFNVQVGFRDPRFFVGLPIPAAALILTLVVLGADHFSVPANQASIFMLVLMYLLSFLMVSNLPYRSLKEVTFSRRHYFNLLVAGVLVFSLIAYRPVVVGVLILGVYLGSGPVLAAVWKRSKKKRQAERAARPLPVEQDETL